MRAKFMAAAAVGALFAGPAFAQTDQTAGGSNAGMTQQDIEDLGNAFEKAGLSNFRPVTGGDVFRGMSADGTSAVIAVAPDTGNNAADAGTTGGAAGDTGRSGMFQVTTEDGRTLYVVVRPEMTGMTHGTTTGDAGDTDTDATDTDTATTTGDGDNNTTGDNAETTTTADADAGATTGADTTDGDADAAAGNNTTDAGEGGEMSMNIDLSGQQQVPPVETSGSGQIAVTFNSESRELSWKLDYSDLSSDATAAHFHGPADPGETAPPVVPLDDFSDGAEGSATLTEDQAEQLMAGKWYFNLHTENNPNGEIRGQVTQVQ